ncbi:MAG TPA: glycosyltransferase family 2 protein [Mycobacteriales bacterium]|nr:glycosyltransferase family 2 protein [Mycobacteriales bacterium]
MPATSSRTRHPGHVITAVVLCRDNVKLLAKTLDALEAQDRTADRVVAVDMGSSDRSVTVAVDRLGVDNVVRFDGPVDTSSAVAAGLDLVTTRAERRARDDAPLEWIWLLHDDSAPDPAALDELLLRVTHSPSVWLAGPKVRDWDNKLLLRAGLTIDAAGNVDTGLDRREPDQGQRDDVDEVLAVGIAGALVRRDVWEQLGGMDPAWADYAAEIDLGWRVNAAGGRVVVVPHAVLLHAGTDCPGDQPAGTAIRSQAVRRRNGMQIVLTNTAGWLVPLLLLRYLVVGVLHAVALLVLSRRPREAAAELLGVGQVLAAPAVVFNGRRRREAGREVSYGDLRRLFPPAGRWLSGMLSVRMHSPTATDAPVNRRRRAAVETGPVSEESEALGDELSAFGEFLRRPASLLLIVTGLLAIVANRHVLSGTLHGGRLLPAPPGASDLWSSYFSAWHASSVGSVAPSPASTALLAGLSTILLGKTWLAVDVLFLGVVPLAAVSAFTALRVFTTTVRVRVWVSIVYALLPAVTGAAASGRLDLVVAAIVLPRVARGVFLAWHPDAAGTMRGRCVRAGLWLAVAAAFAPLIWLVVAVVCASVVAAGYFLPNRDPDVEAADDPTPAMPILDRLGAAGAILAVPLLVLLPWSLHVIAHPGLLFSGSGTQEFYASRSAPSGLSLALLHAGGTGEPPVWVGIPIVAAVILGLRRASRLSAARIGAGVFALGLVVAVLETRSAGVTGGYPSTRHWPGLALLIAGAGALLAALVAAVGARPALRDQSFSWRQPAAVVVVALALISTVTLVGGWLIRGGGHPLRGGDPSALPVYVQAELDVPTAGRALILDGDGHLVRYALVRTSDGPRLGAGDLPVEGGPAQRASAALASAVRDLVAGRPGAGAELVPLGVDYVVAPTATARHVAPELGQDPTLTVIPVPGATVWHSTLATGELTVLTGANIVAAEAGRVPSAAPASVLNTSGGVASPSASVAPAAVPRLLVLAEPASSHWRASVDGHALTSKTAYGWAQAFELPPGGGHVAVSYDSGSRHLWLLVELVLLAGVMLYGAGAGPHVPHREST